MTNHTEECIRFNRPGVLCEGECTTPKTSIPLIRCFDRCFTPATWMHIRTGYVFCRLCSIDNGRDDEPQNWVEISKTNLLAHSGEPS